MIKWRPNWMRFSLRSLLLCPLLFGSVLALNHNWAPWYLERKLAGHSAEIRTAAFSSDGRKVITAGADGTARICDVQSGTGTIVYSVNLGFENFLVSAEFSPDGRRAAIAGYDSSKFVLDSKNKVLLGTVGIVVFDVEKNTVLDYVRREQYSRCARFSPDGRDLLTLFADGKILIFDTMKGFSEPRVTIDTSEEGTMNAFYSPDGKTIAVGNNESLRLFDAQNGTPKGSLQGLEVGHSAVFSPDGKYIVFTSYSGVCQWDLATLTVTDRKYIIRDDYWAPTERAAEYSPDGNLLLTSGGHLVRIRSLDGRTLFVLPHHFSVYSAKYSSDGERIVTASDDGLARIWRKTRPEEWWGIAWRAELWLAIVFAAALYWSLRRDWSSKGMALTAHRGNSIFLRD